MITGAERFSVAIYPSEDGEYEFQLDINKVSIEHLYKVCYTICKKIEEGNLKSDLKPSGLLNQNLN